MALTLHGRKVALNAQPSPMITMAEIRINKYHRLKSPLFGNKNCPFDKQKRFQTIGGIISESTTQNKQVRRVLKPNFGKQTNFVMKIKSIFSILLAVAVSCIAVYACQKEIARQEPSILAPLNIAVVDRATDVHKITCTGSCQEGEHPDPSESTCEAMLYDGNTGTIECPCKNCTMQVSNQLSTTSSYDKYFNEHLMAKIGTVKVLLYSIEIEKYPGAEVILFEYKIPTSAARGTVMYITKFNASGQRSGPVVEIDCTGGCDNATETCRERYIISTGNAECTCEGTCKLTVTYKE